MSQENLLNGDLRIHDATLVSIDFLWKESNCKIYIKSWSRKENRPVNAVMEFFGVTEIHIPKHQEWGPSVSINEIELKNESYKIEMQSGDVISISSKGVNLVAL
jgi:hypothetical protein